MTHKNLWIEIAPEWIEFAIISRGRVRQIHRMLIDQSEPSPKNDHDEDTPRTSPNLRHNIAHGLSLLNIPKATAHVIWHPAGSWVDMQTVNAPPAAAPGAAALAFCAANALDQDTWATGAHVVSSAISDNKTPEASVLVSAIRNDLLAEIESAVEEAGATLRGVIPAQSLALLQAARDAIDASSRDEYPIITIHSGEETTCIAIAQQGTLLMARTLELGFSMLREAYIRAGADQDAESPEAFLAANKRLLESEGIPSPKGGGADAIAIFQTARPFLQRLFIELKQTVRFTIEEDELDVAKVRLTGPGAAIPRFAPMLSEEVGFASVETIHPDVSPLEPGFGISTALRFTPASMAIQAPGRVESRERSNRRAALLYGAIAAAVLLAGDAFLAQRSVMSAERQIRTLETQLADWRERAQTGLGINPQALAQTLETLIRSESALRADWGVVLAEIVGSRPDNLWLSSVTGERTTKESLISFQAITRSPDPDADPHDTVATLVETLQASPLVSEVMLRGTEQFTVDNEQGLRFSITLSLHESQAPWLTAETDQ